MYTRQDYLSRRCTHEQYYAQFVTEQVKDLVAQSIGIDRLKASIAPAFNDIPLLEWDSLVPILEVYHDMRAKKKAHGDTWSIAGGVCILKEAARQLVHS